MPSPPRAFRVAVVTLLVIAALLAAARRDPWDPDETRYLQVTRELLEGDSHLLLTFNGEPYSHKPPLFFWLLAPFVALLGSTSAVAGAIPSAVSTLALALLVPRLGRRAGLSPASAAWGGLMTITALLPALMTGGCRMDLLLVVWCVLALERLAALADPASSDVRRDHLLLWLWIGLGLLTKGPVALALPLLAAAALLPVDRLPLVRAVRGPGPLLAAAMVALWLVPAALVGGRAWLESVLIHQTADRLVDSFAHESPWWYHLATVPATLLPWPLVALAGAVAGLRRLPALPPGARLLVVYPVVTVGLLSLLSGKNVLYPLPMFPAACLTAAWWLERSGDGLRRRIAVGVTAGGFAVVGLGLGWAAAHSTRLEVTAGAAALLALSFALPALAAARAAARGRLRTALAALVIASPTFVVAGLQGLLPPFDRYLSLRPFAESWLAHAPPDQHEVLVLDDLQPGYVLFTRRPARLITDAAAIADALDHGRLLVLKRKNLDRLGLDRLGPLTVRAEVGYRSSRVLMVAR